MIIVYDCLYELELSSEAFTKISILLLFHYLWFEIFAVYKAIFCHLYRYSDLLLYSRLTEDLDQDKISSFYILKSVSIKRYLVIKGYLKFKEWFICTNKYKQIWVRSTFMGCGQVLSEEFIHFPNKL